MKPRVIYGQLRYSVFCNWWQTLYKSRGTHQSRPTTHQMKRKLQNRMLQITKFSSPYTKSSHWHSCIRLTSALHIAYTLLVLRQGEVIWFLNKGKFPFELKSKQTYMSFPHLGKVAGETPGFPAYILETNNLLYPHQFWFREGHLYELALSTIISTCNQCQLSGISWHPGRLRHRRIARYSLTIAMPQLSGEHIWPHRLLPLTEERPN